jgi:glyoxylase I family protein
MLKESIPPLRQALFNTGKRQTPTIYGHHHCGFRCRNAEETRHFYEDILGLPLNFVVYHDKVPSTGEEHPYCHLFFELGDGSSLGFFDLFDDKLPTPDPVTPKWVNHFAFQVDSPEALQVMKGRLEANGVEVLGPIDHKIFDSIYFFDPNGIRLELVYQTAAPDVMKAKGEKAHALLAKFEEMRAYYKNGGKGQGPSAS